eukprot:1688900-Rhodomonas_salina.2
MSLIAEGATCTDKKTAPARAQQNQKSEIRTHICRACRANLGVSVKTRWANTPEKCRAWVVDSR